MRTVRDVMRGDIEVLRTTETAADAACFLAAHGEDSVPLCLGDGSLAGTVSNRDIVARVVAHGRDPREVSVGRVRRARRRAGARRRPPGRRGGVHHVPSPARPAARDRGRSCRRFRDPARRRPVRHLPAAVGRRLNWHRPRPGPAVSADRRPVATAGARARRVVRGDDETPELGAGQLDHDGRAPCRGRRRSPSRSCPARADGDHVGESRYPAPACRAAPARRRRDDRPNRRERDPDVAVDALGLLDRTHPQHQFVPFDVQVGPGGRV